MQVALWLWPQHRLLRLLLFAGILFGHELIDVRRLGGALCDDRVVRCNHKLPAGREKKRQAGETKLPEWYGYALRLGKIIAKVGECAILARIGQRS